MKILLENVEGETCAIELSKTGETKIDDETVYMEYMEATLNDSKGNSEYVIMVVRSNENICDMLRKIERETKMKFYTL